MMGALFWRMKERWVVAGIPLLLLMPLAGAAQGELVLAGSFAIDGRVEIEALSPAVVFKRDAADDWTLEGDAQKINATVVTMYSRSAGPLVLSSYNVTEYFEWTHATISAKPTSRGGWFGFYTSPGTSTMSGSVPDGLSGLVQSSSLVGNSRTAVEDEPDPSVYYFSQRIDPSHVELRLAGELGLSGDLLGKLAGPDMIVTVGDTAQTFSTGTMEASSPAEETIRRWVTFRLEGAAVTLTGDYLVAATQVGELRWDGTLHAQAVGGEIVTEDARYLPAGERAHISGTFVGEILDFARTPDRFSLPMDGSLASTSLSRVPMPGRTSPPTGLLWLMGGGFAIALAAVSGVVIRRRLDKALLSPDQLAALADDAIGTRRFDLAAEWLRQLLIIAPTSGRSWTDYGYALAESGAVQEALGAYARAGQLTDHGEPELLAARLLLSTGDADAAETFLLKALRKAPAHAFDIEDDPHIDPLRTRPAVREAIAMALRDCDES